MQVLCYRSQVFPGDSADYNDLNHDLSLVLWYILQRPLRRRIKLKAVMLSELRTLEKPMLLPGAQSHQQV